MDNGMEWEWCTCDWVGGNPEQNCGGCERQCRLYRDDVLHWQGNHWHPVCALGHAITRIKDQEKEIEGLDRCIEREVSQLRKEKLGRWERS